VVSQGKGCIELCTPAMPLPAAAGLQDPVAARLKGVVDELQGADAAGGATRQPSARKAPHWLEMFTIIGADVPKQ